MGWAGFRGGFRGKVPGVEQSEVAADLAQSKECGEDEHAALGESLGADGVGDFLTGGGQHLLIDGRLILGEIAEGDLFDLGWQFLRDLGFASTQQERSDAAGETIHAGLVLFACDGDLVTFAEILGGTEITGHEEIEQTPKIEDRILEGSAGEDDPALGSEEFDGLGVLGLAILDVLGFVEDDRIKLVGLIAIEVAADESVAGDDQIRFGDALEQGMALVAMEGEHLEIRGKLGGFVGPVRDERSGANDEVRKFWFGPRALDGGEVCQDLNGFAETHFIGENAAEGVGAKKLEPGHAVFLVVAEDRIERAEVGARKLGFAPLSGGAGAPLLRGANLETLLREGGVEKTGLGIGHAEGGALRSQLLTGSAIEQDLLQFLDGTGIHDGPFAIAQAFGTIAEQELLNVGLRKAFPARGVVRNPEIKPLFATGCDTELRSDPFEMILGAPFQSFLQGDRPIPFHPGIVPGEKRQDAILTDHLPLALGVRS